MLTDRSEFDRLTTSTPTNSLPIIPTNDAHWMKDAKCTELDPYAIDEIFFVEKGQSYAHAKRYCSDCPVKLECGQYALKHSEPLDGYWGGLSRKDRTRLRQLLNLKVSVEETVVTFLTETAISTNRTVGTYLEITEHSSSLGTDD